MDSLTALPETIEQSQNDAKNRQSHDKPMNIPCEEAIAILRMRFPGVTNREISLWLSLDESLAVKDSPFADAETIDYHEKIRGYALDAAKPELDDFLYRWYFSKTEVEAFQPSTRWHEYRYMEALAPYYGLSVAAMKRVILREISLEELEIWNPTPWTDGESSDEKIEAAMYPKSVFPLIFKGWNAGQEVAQVSEAEGDTALTIKKLQALCVSGSKEEEQEQPEPCDIASLIPYLEAKTLLKPRFYDLTDKELLIWVENGATLHLWADKPKTITPRNARGKPVNYGHLDKDAAYQGDDNDRIASILVPLYFSKQEVEEADPERWLSYEQLKRLVAEIKVSEAELVAKIQMRLGGADLYDPMKWGDASFDIYDPIPRCRKGRDSTSNKDRLKTAMYRAVWIQEAFPKLSLERFKKMAADNSTEPCQSKIIRKVYGRDVVPVWSLPYVNLKGWSVLAGVEAMLQSLAHQACGAVAPEFLTAYSLNAHGGPVPIDFIQWEDCLDYVASITHGYKQTEAYQRRYGEWRDGIAKYVPSQAFLFVDELSAWYYATIENNVDEEENTIFVLKLDAEGERTVCIPYRREDYRLSLDPLIPREVVERHQEWFVLDSQQDGGHDCQPRQELKAKAGNRAESCLPAQPQPDQNMMVEGECIDCNQNTPELNTQQKREAVLRQWIEQQESINSSFDRNKVPQSRKHIWDELRKLDKDLFPPENFERGEPPSTPKKFFDTQKLFSAKPGRK